MKLVSKRIALGLLCSVFLISAFLVPVPAQNKRTNDAARHASDAARVFSEIMKIRRKTFPGTCWIRPKRLPSFPVW